MDKKEKNLEQWQLEDAYRLRKLVEAYLDAHKISQEDFMSKGEYSQQLYFQLLGSEKRPPKRGLNLDQAYFFSKTLDIPIERFSPTLARRILELSTRVDDDWIHESATG